MRKRRFFIALKKGGYFHMKKVLFLALFVTLMICLFLGCEGDPGFMAMIDDEIEWANSPRLNITMVYPQEWGSGVDRFYDNVRTLQNPRVGYPFSVQFAPAAAYGEAQWRAYKTAELPPLASNWFISTASIRTTLQELDPENDLLLKDEVIFATPIGSSSVVTINIPDAITIIPWSYMQPRIIHSSPPVTATYEDNFERNANRDITVTFAAAVIQETLIFGTGFIEITKNTKDGEEDKKEDITDLFISPPGYDDETFTMTIQSKGNIEAGINIEVTLGKGIESVGDRKGMNEHAKFSWHTNSLEDSISGLEASYNAVDKQIEVKWILPPRETRTPRLNYRINNGSIISLPVDHNNKESYNITNISPPDYGGITEGRAITGINSYTIFVYLGDSIKTIKIWNIPDMFVSDAKPLIELNQATGLSIPKEAEGQYVLTSNITIANHTPIADFSGIFYGNGHTITISSFAELLFAEPVEVTNIGLFGVVDGGNIRDLTVHYNAVTVETTGEARFGGLSGTADGGARFENVLVTGAVDFTGNNKNFVGGIAGQLTNKEITASYTTRTTIYNAYSGINLSVINREANPGNSIYVGGIAGTIGWGTGKEGTAATVERASAVGNINVGTAGERISSYRRNIYDNRPETYNHDSVGLFVGGLAGIINGQTNNHAILKDANYRLRVISVWINSGDAYLGGALGTNYRADVTNCSAAAGSFYMDKSGSGSFFAGGFIGDVMGAERSWENYVINPGGIIQNCYSDIPIIINNSGLETINAGGFAGRIGGPGVNCKVFYCYAKGNVSILGVESINAGGFAGIIVPGSPALFCYAAGNVSVVHKGEITPQRFIYVGGFTGQAVSLSDCYALGDVFVDSSSTATNGDIIYVGSLVGNYSHGFLIDRCFARGDVIVQRNANVYGDMFVGGLVGAAQSNRIENSVSLTRSITVMGLPLPDNAAERRFCRILGRATLDWYRLTNNYAYIDMTLRHKTNVTERTTNTIPVAQIVNNRTNKDGADAHLGTFRSRAFWTSPAPNGVGFSTEITIDSNITSENHPFYGLTPGDKYPAWNFSTVEERGYPILRTHDGSVMSGQ